MAGRYKRNYLDNVVLRLDFNKLEGGKSLDTFLEKLDSLFPYKEYSSNFADSIEINLEKDEVVKNREEVLTWDYLDAYKTKKVRLTPTFIAIEYLNRTYTDSKELLNDFENILKVFIDDLSITTINRIGLRYINRFDLDTEVDEIPDWSKFFSKDLVGSINFAKKLKYPIARSMHNLQLKADDHDILVRFGIWNQDFPSENTRKEFILDIDAFSRFAVENVNQIKEIVSQYNKNIEKIFEKSIASETKVLLEKKND